MPISILSFFLRVLAIIMITIPPLSAQENNTQTSEQAAEEIALSPLATAIRNELAARGQQSAKKAQRRRLAAIAEYYGGRGYEPLWVAGNALNDRALSIINNLNAADQHGLNARDYAVELPAGEADPQGLGKVEVDFAIKLVSYAQHLNAGRLNPRAVSKENVIYPEAIGAATILGQASTTTNTSAYLRLLAPRTPRYERLRLAMLEYRKIAASGGLEQIAKGEVLKPGMEDPRVPQLRRLLATLGDYVGNQYNPSFAYDGDIVDAVINFQRRHGLEEDGVVGPNTLRELNIPIEDRVTMMAHNLERRRWMQDDYGSYYIFANLADQVLKVVKNEKTIFAELIQVGLPYHRTPVFSDELEYVEINPYWNVPRSIATNELLPSLKKNPVRLASQNYEVLASGNVYSPAAISWASYSKGNFPFRIRQRPGKGNALGRIKFMFPNNFNVYIHDTPSRSKFDRASRYFSHGCLRLRNPLKMAEVILGDLNWNRQKIDAVVASKKRRVVKLKRKIPVHIAYMTAWVNKDGSVHFRRDVYGRDIILGQALERISG